MAATVEEGAWYSIDQVRAENNEPLLPGIEAAYILTMHNTGRLTEERIAALSTLARLTYVQTNHGFRGRDKPGVDCSSKDIVHAYKNACAHAMDKGLIVVIEDDAEFMGDASSIDFKRVNNFVASCTNLNMYSLGSLGFTYPVNRHHRRFLGFMGFVQCTIMSRAARDFITSVDIGTVRHIDAHVMRSIPNKYTYYKPLVVQRFTTTENMLEWGVCLKPNRVERIAVRLFVFLIQRVMCLSTSTRGWKGIYAINSLPWVTALLVTLFIMVVVVCFLVRYEL